ncbi:MAG TPA: zinc-binding protein [Cyanobacteria bacterium UBA8530]|nr:zinc-binding protein [Cyanobacteria bacterium UBA8530]
MSKCGCGSTKTIIMACSGASNVGQIANDAAKALDQLGQGSMFCGIGVGAQLSSFVNGAKEADVRVSIDGCKVACIRRTLEKAGITPELAIVVTDLGIEKKHDFDYPREQVAQVAGAVADALQSNCRL